MSDTPVYDQLIAERLGRGPTEFEGHDTWDESEEAAEAYARGVAEAKATWDAFWGNRPETPTPPPPRQAGPRQTARPRTKGPRRERPRRVAG